MVTVEQLMAKSLVNIGAAMSAMEAAKMMKKHQVGSVLVKRDHRIVGIVTEPDIIRKVIGVERIPYYVPVEEIMSSPVIGIDWRRPITEAANMMNQHRTRHLAVFNGGSVVGVLSVRDLLHPVSVDEL
jgi:CBS domain-containing protein